MTSIAPVTRRVARIVLTTIKKIGSSRGVTLKKIHDYIKQEYPNTPHNIVRLNNTLQKALAFGAVAKNKNNKYILGSVIKQLTDSKGRKKVYHILQGPIRKRKIRNRGRSRKRTIRRSASHRRSRRRRSVRRRRRVMRR